MRVGTRTGVQGILPCKILKDLGSKKEKYRVKSTARRGWLVQAYKEVLLKQVGAGMCMWVHAQIATNLKI